MTYNKRTSDYKYINRPFKMRCNLSIAMYIWIMNVFHVSYLVNYDILLLVTAYVHKSDCLPNLIIRAGKIVVLNS